MTTNRTRLLSLLICLALATGMAHAQSHHKAKKTTHHASKASAHKSKTSKTRRAAHRKARRRGQQAMDPSRVREIQAALIREKYLEGQPTGIWDQRSKDAMQRYQSANGWQTKMVPDSRALIKLGLGPDRADLINPDTAAISYIPGGGSSAEQR